MYEQKSLTLCWHLLLNDSNHFLAIIFAHTGGQYIEFGLMLLNSPWIIQDVSPKIVEAQLTFLFKR